MSRSTSIRNGLVVLICAGMLGCGDLDTYPEVAWESSPLSAGVYPASDPQNTGGWIANNALSDEFTVDKLDETKWAPETWPGMWWTGRSPSRFDPANVSVSGGSLHLKTANKNLLGNTSFEAGNLGAWKWRQDSPYTGTAGVIVGNESNQGDEPNSKYRGLYVAKLTGAGAIEQTVTGLTPNTTYKLSGYAKVAIGSPAPYIGVKWYGGAETATYISSTSWQEVSMDFKTGSNNTTALVYLYNASSVGTVYADEIAVVLKQMPSRQKNELGNTGFELGTLSPWYSWGSGGGVVSTRAKKSGTYGAEVTGYGGLEQEVTGLAPNTTYRLWGSARVANGSPAPYVGVKWYGGAETCKYISGTSWTDVWLDFTTGSTNTTALVYFFNAANGGTMYGDNMWLEQYPRPPGIVMDGDFYVTSSAVQGKVDPLYGYFETRVRASRSPTSSSFWLFGSETEIDIYELSGAPTLAPWVSSTMPTNIHYFPPPCGMGCLQSEQIYVSTGVQVADNFHTYGLDWNESSIKFYFDGNLVRETANAHHFLPMHLLLDTEVMQQWGIPADGATSSFDIDYIRSWTH